LLYFHYAQLLGVLGVCFFKNVQVSALPDRDSNKASTVVLAF